MAKSGGLVTLEDLAAYKPRVREVLRAKYESGGHEWEGVTSPPPSSGGVAIIEALNMLRDVPLKGWDDVGSGHMVAETMRRGVCGWPGGFGCSEFLGVGVGGG